MPHTSLLDSGQTNVMMLWLINTTQDSSFKSALPWEHDLQHILGQRLFTFFPPSPGWNVFIETHSSAGRFNKCKCSCKIFTAYCRWRQNISNLVMNQSHMVTGHNSYSIQDLVWAHLRHIVYRLRIKTSYFKLPCSIQASNAQDKKKVSHAAGLIR